MAYSVCLGLNERLTVAAIVLMAAGWAQAADLPSDAKPPVPLLLQKMEGNWTVSEKMWPGSGEEAVDLPAATAHRRLIQKSFLEEVMEPTAHPMRSTERLTSSSIPRPINLNISHSIPGCRK